MPACLQLTRAKFRELYYQSSRLPPVLEGLSFVVPQQLPTGMLAHWQPPFLPPFSETVLMLSKQNEHFDLDSCSNAAQQPAPALNPEGKVSLAPRLLLNLNGKPYQSCYGNETLFLYVEQKSCIGRRLAMEITNYCQFVRAKSLLLIVNNRRSGVNRADANPLTNFAVDVYEEMQANRDFRFELATFARTTFDPTNTEGFSQRHRFAPDELARFLRDTPGTSLASLQTEPADDPVSLFYGYRPGDVLEIRNPDDDSIDHSIVV